MPSPWPPGTVPVGGRMEEVGALRALVPSWAGSRGRRELCHFTLGRRRRKAVLLLLLNPPPFLCYQSAKSLTDTIFVAHRNGAGLPLERNAAAGMASVHLGATEWGRVLPRAAALCLRLRW